MFKQENKTKTPEAFQTQSQPLKQSYTKLCEVALCRPVLVNANVKYKHHHLLPENPFLTFDVNARADVTGEEGFPPGTNGPLPRQSYGINCAKPC